MAESLALVEYYSEQIGKLREIAEHATAEEIGTEGARVIYAKIKELKELRLDITKALMDLE